MKSGVHKIFREHVHTVESHTGLTLPPLVKMYVAELLAYYVDKPHSVSPELSYTIRVSEISNRVTAKQLGDEILWITSVIGNPRARFGVSTGYILNLGATAYRQTQSEVLHTIADEIPTVSRFVRTATRDYDCPLGLLDH